MNFSSISSDNIPFSSLRLRVQSLLCVSPHILLSCGKGHFHVSPKWSQFTQHVYLRPLEFSTKIHFVSGTLHWPHIYTRSSVVSIPTIRQNSKYDYMIVSMAEQWFVALILSHYKAPLPFFFCVVERVEVLMPENLSKCFPSNFRSLS